MATNTFGQDITQAGGSVIPTAPTAPTAPPPGIDSNGNSVWVSSPDLNPTIPVSGLSTTQTAIQIPQQPAVDTGASANASIPSVQSIVEGANTTTVADKQQSDLLNSIAKLTGSQQSLATQQITQENAAGIPALAATLTQLNNQLQGLNDQATKLQLDASVGGTIQNQNQQDAEGRGRTVGGNAPLLAGALRMNQIQQASIASQALTVKAAVYAAQGQYSIAKDAADKAAQVLFDATQQEINHQQALLAAIQPQLNKEQSARAVTLQANLADRQKQVDAQREDFKTGQALAIAAMKNFSSDSTAQFAAQQALKLNPSTPNYLQQVMALVGKYQNDPAKVAQDLADLDYKRSQTALNKAQTVKTNQEAQAASPTAMTAQVYNDRADTINLVNGILDDKHLSFALGGQNLNPFNYIPGNATQPVKAQIDQLIAKLSLDNRSKLKGSGAISDFESRTLEKSASSFNRSLSYNDAVKQLKQIRGVLTTLNGGTALVQVKDPVTGQTQNATADRDAITKMANAGLIIQYQ